MCKSCDYCVLCLHHYIQTVLKCRFCGGMEMKQFILILVIFTVMIMGVSFASNAYINDDNWNKGDLKEVAFEYPACLVEIC